MRPDAPFSSRSPSQPSTATVPEAAWAEMVAAAIPERWTRPEAVRAAVRQVLADPSYREAARRVQAEIASLPGPERGVTLLEQLVTRHAVAVA